MAGTERPTSSVQGGPAQRASDGRTSHAPQPAPRAEAIVVLGCRVHPCGRLTAAAAGRASAAAAAFRAGVAPRVIASGGRRWGAQIEAVALKGALVDRGVPERAVLTELWSFTTVENAIFTSALLRRLGVGSAVIVTCSWHVPRALMSFRAAGIDASAWPRPAVPGAFDRHAERFRRAYDALLFGASSSLSARADAFLSASSPPLSAAAVTSFSAAAAAPRSS